MAVQVNVALKIIEGNDNVYAKGHVVFNRVQIKVHILPAENDQPKSHYNYQIRLGGYSSNGLNVRIMDQGLYTKILGKIKEKYDKALYYVFNIKGTDKDTDSK